METKLHTTGEESVTLEREGSVALITFSSQKANSLSGRALAALTSAVERCAADGEVRVIGLRSGGTGAFCAGASFDEFKAIDSEPAATEFFMGFARLILAMRSAPKFIVTCVQGKAVGGGVGVLAGSDLVVAAPTAAVRLSEFEIGIGPFVIGAAVERKVGAAHFASLAIDCQWRDATWALGCGLYHTVVADGAELEHTWRTRLEELAGRSPAATAELKRLLWHGTAHWESLLPERAAVSGRLLKA